jgi:hypothetical protein
MTRKSVSLEMGAMAKVVWENCRESKPRRLRDDAEEGRERLVNRESGNMESE